ncbi:hypothetical protein KCP73_03860 [Salmonella enterica subsp. enterica]|nr:hypothetical protein KCP73_03860 [Salmonella enterica subsp. enterica]
MSKIVRQSQRFLAAARFHHRDHPVAKGSRRIDATGKSPASRKEFACYRR